jgi:hypothetical protein
MPDKIIFDETDLLFAETRTSLASVAVGAVFN